MKRLLAFVIIMSMIILMNSNICGDFESKVSACMDNYIYNHYGEYELITIENVLDFDALIDRFDMEIVNTETISDRVIIEGYCSDLNKYIVIDGVRVNIQISYYDNKMIIGYPLIMQSF